MVCTTPGRTEIAFGDRAPGYLKQQAGAAIQNFLLKITEAKLSKIKRAGYKDEIASLENGVIDYVKNYLLGKLYLGM